MPKFYKVSQAVKCHSVFFCLGTEVPRLSAGVGMYVRGPARRNTVLQYAHVPGDNSSIGVSEVSLLPEAPDILAKDKIRKPQRSTGVT